MKVNNVCENFNKYPWMVVRLVEDEFWYYGSWNDLEKAMKQAAEVSGAVIPSSAVK